EPACHRTKQRISLSAPSNSRKNVFDYQQIVRQTPGSNASLKVLLLSCASKTGAAMTDLDDLRAELDEFAQPEKKKSRSPREERIIAGFEELQRFVEQHGHKPRHGEDND